MRAGKLRQRITLQTRSATRDALGQEVESWSDAGTYYGEVRPLVGRELAHAQQLRADITLAVAMRWPGFAPGPEQRIGYRSRILNIAHVLDLDERRREITLLCTEVLSAAKEG